LHPPAPRPPLFGRPPLVKPPPPVCSTALPTLRLFRLELPRRADERQPPAMNRQPLLPPHVPRHRPLRRAVLLRQQLSASARSFARASRLLPARYQQRRRKSIDDLKSDSAQPQFSEPEAPLTSQMRKSLVPLRASASQERPRALQALLLAWEQELRPALLAPRSVHERARLIRRSHTHLFHSS